MAQIQFSLIKKIKIGHPEHSLTPHPSTSDNISFLPYPPPPLSPLKVDVICVSPLRVRGNSMQEQGIWSWTMVYGMVMLSLVKSQFYDMPRCDSLFYTIASGFYKVSNTGTRKLAICY